MGREGVLRLPANSTRRAHPLVALPHATAPPPSAPPHLLRARPKPHLNATRAEWPNPSDRTRVTHARLAHNASRHAHAEAPAHNASRHAHAEAPAHNASRHAHAEAPAHDASRHAHAEAPAHDASRHAHAEALPTVGRAAARSILHLLVPFALALCAIVAAEDGFLRGLPALKLRHAACWLLMFGAFCVTTGLLVAAMQGWEASGTYFFCLGLNVILSPDNLVVFMMLLQQAKLPVRYHFRAISHGLIVAAVLRTIAMIGGAFLLNHFAWFGLAALIIISGVRLLVSTDTSADESAAASEHWAVRTLSSLLPMLWSDQTGDAYFVRDQRNRLCITRMAALVIAIAFTDLAFATDSITSVLTTTSDVPLIIMSQCLSIMLLRPIYFLLAAVLLQMDAINSILALILITIGTKIFLSAADVEVPTWLFVGALTAWRVLMGLIALRATYAVPEIPDNTEGTTTLDEASARMCSTK